MVKGLPVVHTFTLSTHLYCHWPVMRTLRPQMPPWALMEKYREDRWGGLAAKELTGLAWEAEGDGPES